MIPSESVVELQVKEKASSGLSSFGFGGKA